MASDPCVDRIVKKIASLFKGEEAEAERLIRERIDTDEELRLKAIFRHTEYQPLDLLDLLVGFARISRKPIKRMTPLIELLKIELRVDDRWAGKFADPRSVFDEESLPYFFGTVSTSPHQRTH